MSQLVFELELSDNALSTLYLDTICITISLLDSNEIWKIHGKTNHSSLSKKIQFSKLIYFPYSLLETTIKLEIESSNQNDTKVNELIWKRVVPKPLESEKKYTFQVDYNQMDIGLLGMSIENVELLWDMSNVINPCLYRLSFSLDTISLGFHLQDSWDTLSIYSQSLLYVLEKLKSQFSYETKSPYQLLIRDSFLRGLYFRQKKITMTMESNVLLGSTLKEKILLIRSKSNGQEVKRSTLYWNFPKFQSLSVKKPMQESQIYKVYVHQAINELSHQFDRVLFDFEKEMGRIHLAATLHAPGDPSSGIVNNVVSNIIQLCIKTNDLVVHILSEIAKDQEFMDPIVENISNTLGILQLQILPQLENQSKRQVKLGLVLKNAFHLLQELIEKMKRLLSLQGIVLLSGFQNKNKFIPKPWWSHLIFETDFIQLIQVISMAFQRNWRSYLDIPTRNPQFWKFILHTGYPVAFYSQVIPDNGNIHIFEELSFKLNQLEKNLKIRFHSDTHFSQLQIKMDLQSIELSFPISSSEAEILAMFTNQSTCIRCHPFLILPKKPKYLAKWSDTPPCTDHEAELHSKSLSINNNSLKLIRSFIKSVQNFSLKRDGVKPFGILSSHLQSHLQSVEHGIQGTDHTFYFSSLERDVQITLLTSRLLSFLSVNISNHFYKSQKKSDLWSSIWIQDTMKEAAFTLEDADYLFHNYKVSLDSALII